MQTRLNPKIQICYLERGGVNTAKSKLLIAAAASRRSGDTPAIAGKVEGRLGTDFPAAHPADAVERHALGRAVAALPLAAPLRS